MFPLFGLVPFLLKGVACVPALVSSLINPKTENEKENQNSSTPVKNDRGTRTAEVPPNMEANIERNDSRERFRGTGDVSPYDSENSTSSGSREMSLSPADGDCNGLDNDFCESMGMENGHDKHNLGIEMQLSENLNVECVQQTDIGTDQRHGNGCERKRRVRKSRGKGHKERRRLLREEKQLNK